MIKTSFIRASYLIKYFDFESVYKNALSYSFDDEYLLCQNTNVFMFPNQVNWRTIFIWLSWFFV